MKTGGVANENCAFKRKEETCAVRLSKAQGAAEGGAASLKRNKEQMLLRHPLNSNQKTSTTFGKEKQSMKSPNFKPCFPPHLKKEICWVQWGFSIQRTQHREGRIDEISKPFILNLCSEPFSLPTI
jgi:hypothetical protein